MHQSKAISGHGLNKWDFPHKIQDGLFFQLGGSLRVLGATHKGRNRPNLMKLGDKYPFIVVPIPWGFGGNAPIKK